MLDEEGEETQTSAASTSLDDIFATSSPVSDYNDFELDAISDDDTFGNSEADSDRDEADFSGVAVNLNRLDSPEGMLDVTAGQEHDMLEDDDIEYDAGVSSPPLDDFFEDCRKLPALDLDRGDCYEGDTAPISFDGVCDVETGLAHTIESHDQGEHIHGPVVPHGRARNIDRSRRKAAFAPGSDLKSALRSAFLEDVLAETRQGSAFVPLGLSGQEVDDLHSLFSFPRKAKSYDHDAPLPDFDSALNVPSAHGSAPDTHSTLIGDGDIFGL